MASLMESRLLWISRVLAIVCATASLAGCNFWIAGHSSDLSLVVRGDGLANPGDGTTTFTMQIEGSDVVCKGTSKPLEKPGDNRNWASTELTCNDGRVGKGETVLGGMEWGTGTGTDTCGNEFLFYFHINQYVVERKLEEYRRQRQSNSGAGDLCLASGDAPPHRDPLI